MTEAQAIEAILERWETGWLALHPADPNDPNHVAYTFDNEEFTTIDMFARVTILHTIANQRSMGPVGSRRFERRGNIAVQLFVPVDQGRKIIAGLAGDVRTVLEAVTIGTTDCVYTYAGATRENPTDDRWFMTTVVIPFSYWAQR